MTTRIIDIIGGISVTVRLSRREGRGKKVGSQCRRYITAMPISGHT